LRLTAWARWQLGSRDAGEQILESWLPAVRSTAERGRWVDLLGALKRFNVKSAFTDTVAQYYQALSVKRAAQDQLRVAMALQELAFVHAEQLDFEQALLYLQNLERYADDIVYDGASESRAIALLGEVWIEAMRGDNSGVALGSDRLASFHQMRRRAKVSQLVNELHIAAKALDYFLSIMWGRPTRTTLDAPQC